MLRFFRQTDAEQATGALSARLRAELEAGKRVLWLLGGGSNIPLSVGVMRALPAARLKQLAIMMTDERYGPFDHPDSNARQLREAGFAPGEAVWVPMLTPENAPLETAAARYSEALATAFDHAQIVIAQLGIGADGHIAGMLPGSPAVSAAALVAGYDAGTFTRLTITPPAFRQIDAAYAFVYGPAKRAALATLQQQDVPVAEQPAQILKTLPESYVYNDQVGSAA